MCLQDKKLVCKFANYQEPSTLYHCMLAWVYREDFFVLFFCFIALKVRGALFISWLCSAVVSIHMLSLLYLRPLSIAFFSVFNCKMCQCYYTYYRLFAFYYAVINQSDNYCDVRWILNISFFFSVDTISCDVGANRCSVSVVVFFSRKGIQYLAFAIVFIYFWRIFFYLFSKILVSIIV